LINENKETERHDLFRVLMEQHSLQKQAGSVRRRYSNRWFFAFFTPCRQSAIMGKMLSFAISPFNYVSRAMWHLFSIQKHCFAY